MGEYLRIKNWSDFQHYKDRKPPWLKLHRALLDNYEFQCLQLASRALAPMLWLLASETNDLKDPKIPNDAKWIAFRLRQPVQEVADGLSGLIAAGFVIVEQDASSALATCLQHAPSETETETEEREQITPPTPQGGSEVEARQAPARKPRRASTLSQADLALFEQWYGAYPRKVSRGDAEKAWRSITPSKALLEEMMAALAWQVRSHDWTKDNGSFIPYPATYLRAKKWMDQPTAAACSNGSFSQASYETKSDVQDLLRQMGRI